jgi:hypothetical protein
VSDNADQAPIDLVHPLYLDVPMMTSFLAAIQDGIAYGSNVRLKQAVQRATGASGEGEVGVPSLGILSSVLNLSLRGKIEKRQTLDDNEEVDLVKKHTEASLFMQLRTILHEDGQIDIITDEGDLDSVEHGSLVEVTGQILRSPASEALDAAFRLMTMLGLKIPDETPASPQRQVAKKGGAGPNQPRVDALEELQQALERPTGDFTLRFMQRLKDDLTKSKIIDVVMKLPHGGNLSVVIALSSEFLPEGVFENLLSGHFTVLGKVVRVLEGEETLSLYQRSTLASMFSDQMKQGVDTLQQNFSAGHSAGTELVRAPAIQLIPLAIFV